MMVTGINENVEILGRVFHVQTELIPGSETKIRTAVFIGGRMIASQTRPVTAETTNDDDIRQMIRAQQEQIIDNFVTRAAVLAAASDTEKPTANEAIPIRRSPPAVKVSEPPDPEENSGLIEGIGVRRLITRFRQSVGTHSELSDDDLKPFLKKVSRAIRTVTEDTAFIGVRLDEQVAFYDFKSRIKAQLAGEFDDEAARSVSRELSRFSDYLGRINQRRELIAFDRKLFTWALAAVGGSGISDEVVSHLSFARGRSEELDCLLDHPDQADRARWTEILMHLIDITFGDEA